MTTRRDLLKGLGFGVAALGLPSGCVTVAQRASGRNPNVVLIYSDDQGWGDVGYHGYTDVLTPNIDRLAAEGTQFSQGYVSASVCGPSRCGLLTGVYQQRLGVYGNYDKGGIPTSQPTLFEMLKREGYTCGVVGKWHVGMAREELRPNARGADFFYGFLGGSHDYYTSSRDPDDRRRGERPIMRNGQVERPIQESKGYLTEMFTQEAVQFIERTDDEPFCLYLAYNAVHHPWSVPDSYVKRVQHLATHDERKLFAGMVLALDDGVGAVMAALRKKGVADDTLVIFMSDNGSPRGQGIAAPRQKTRGTTTMSSPGPFNGFKGDTYEGGTRVPFVMRWPGWIPKGKTYRQPVINLDIPATVLARCGVSKPWQGHVFDGVDLLPFVVGPKPSAAQPHEVLYWRRGEDYAILAGDWKLARNDQAGPRTIRLFNLAADPGEWKDLAQAHPERAQAMQDLFDAWDSALPDNQSGRNPRNRNTGFVAGKRVDVAEFNRTVAAAPAPRGKAANPNVRTLETELARDKRTATQKGRPFNPEQTKRWFRAKDLNGDGILDERELRTKVRPDWNKVGK
ncbi:MAG: sulfatase-like hydrolase/transferase [Victivallales bacterium]|nr:sulfatase-like hydrolase/transferase [Victivallales bacterium]